MNPWPFVLGAYGLTLLAAGTLAWWSWLSMRRAEREAESIGRTR